MKLLDEHLVQEIEIRNDKDGGWTFIEPVERRWCRTGKTSNIFLRAASRPYPQMLPNSFVHSIWRSKSFWNPKRTQMNVFCSSAREQKLRNRGWLVERRRFCYSWKWTDVFSVLMFWTVQRSEVVVVVKDIFSKKETNYKKGWITSLNIRLWADWAEVRGQD